MIDIKVIQEVLLPERVKVFDDILSEFAEYTVNYEKIVYTNEVGNITFEINKSGKPTIEDKQVVVKKWIDGQFQEVQRYNENEVKQIRYYLNKLELVLNDNIRLFDSQCVVEFEQKELSGKRIIGWSNVDEEVIKETIYFINEYQKSNRCKDENGMQNSVTCEKWLRNLIKRT